MKVVQILGCVFESGAGQAVRALHEALLRRGVDSCVLGRVERNLPASLRAVRAPLRDRLPVSLMNRWYLWNLRRRFGHLSASFHPVSYGLNLSRKREYLSSDIIHIQFSEATTMAPSFWRTLKRERRPVVWTLRGMWPFTGGCQFSGDCEGFVTGCGGCPLLGSSSEHVTSDDLAFKAAHIPEGSVFIAISNVIAEQARRSLALKGRDIRVMPNSNRLDRFRHIEKSDARASLGLPSTAFVVAAGALDFGDPRKGGSILASALEACRGSTDMHAIIFGHGFESHMSDISENIHLLGGISDPQILNNIYSAADVFLMPSLHESFGKVTVEAMASCTPVIAFASTPAEEILIDGETGWLAPHGNLDAFASLIRDAQAIGRERLKEMGFNARKRAVSQFSADLVADKHIELYAELMAREIPEGR